MIPIRSQMITRPEYFPKSRDTIISNARSFMKINENLILYPPLTAASTITRPKSTSLQVDTQTPDDQDCHNFSQTRDLAGSRRNGETRRMKDAIEEETMKEKEGAVETETVSRVFVTFSVVASRGPFRRPARWCTHDDVTT